MSKTIFITGSTDGIGLETAKLLAAAGHRVLLHGRSPAKLAQARDEVAALQGGAPPYTFLADLSELAAVDALGEEILARCPKLDVLMNNAGVFKVAKTTTAEDLEVRFAVNTLAPYALTQKLLARLGRSGRVINLSSAAQAPVRIAALRGQAIMGDNATYAQSKLALTMWTRQLAASLGEDAPTLIAVNPGSFLRTKMVKEAYGSVGADIGIGADILFRAALDPEFGEESGRYFDNDAGRFAAPHADALDPGKSAAVVDAIESILTSKVTS